MTEYLRIILKNIDRDNGKIINILINKGIINYKETLDTLLNEGTDELLYKCAKYVKVLNSDDRRLIINELIKRKSFTYLLHYACEIEDAPVEEIEKVIIDLRMIGIIKTFALKVKGANIKLLEDAIININNPEGIYFFAKEVPGANINRLANAIINTGEPRYISLFARYIKNSNLELLEEALVNTKTLSLDQYKEFLDYKESVQSVDFDKLCISLKDNDLNDLEDNKDKYAYLFKEPSIKSKVLMKKLNDRGY